MSTILLIDDERLPMNYYVKVLETLGHTVIRQHTADEAIELDTVAAKQVEVMVLDVMMPPGEAFKDVDTEEGLRTGVHIYRRLRDQYKAIPIIVLTNVKDYRVLPFPADDALLTTVGKSEYPPLALEELIRSVLDTGAGSG